MRWLIVLFAALAVGACGSDGRESSAAARDNTSASCPFQTGASDADGATVLTGDLDGVGWCLMVSQRDQAAPCQFSISIFGAEPFSESLASGGCTTSLSSLGWLVTDDPTAGDQALLVYGHAPARTTRVRLMEAGSQVVEVRPQRHEGTPDAAFFVTQLPAGSFPDEAVAFDGDREIERKDAPEVTVGP